MGPPFLYTWNNHLYLFSTMQQPQWERRQTFTRFDGDKWSVLNFFGGLGSTSMMAAPFNDVSVGINDTLFVATLGKGTVGNSMFGIILNEDGWNVDYFETRFTTVTAFQP